MMSAVAQVLTQAKLMLAPRVSHAQLLGGSCSAAQGQRAAQGQAGQAWARRCYMQLKLFHF